MGGEEYAVVPLAEYEALRNAVDEDVLDAAIIRRVLEDPDQELVPFELVKRIASGEHPVRVWRKYRGLKAGELAAVAGLQGVVRTRPGLSSAEKSRRGQ